MQSFLFLPTFNGRLSFISLTLFRNCTLFVSASSRVQILIYNKMLFAFDTSYKQSDNVLQ